MQTINDMTRRGFLLAAGASPLLRGQSLSARATWSAKWIAVPKAPATEYGVYHFRKTFELAARPEKFVVHASGDNRYQLFVNGQRVAWGPARGDLFHWRYETVDITGFLRAGRNVVAAVVWNFGEYAPEAQITLQTGFLLQGDTRGGARGGYRHLVEVRARRIVFAGGDHERRRARVLRGGSGRPDSRGAASVGMGGARVRRSAWAAAAVIAPAAGREARDVHTRWMLVPRTIPMMEEKAERPMMARSAQGITWSGKGTAAAHAKATLLLDQTYLTTAYPELTVSGGKGAVVRMRYAEALFTSVAREGQSQRGRGQGLHRQLR